ncbi:MAG: ACP S-malonyltransferase [Acidobacteria bacterium]|nr:ACP S-malonyltransferase [Acidobacteriota bacterium]
MGKLAFIFPGQGSQHAGMGLELSEKFSAGREVFESADEAIGFKLSELCFRGPEEELQLTANTQPSILTASVAAFRVISEKGVKPDVVAGHSLGEYSALVAAGAVSLQDAVRLVRRRGQFMQEAVPVGIGAMAAILGIDATRVGEACAVAAQDQVCAPANFNSPTQIVIAGHLAAVERAVEECKARGARRAMMLKVSAPFHSSLMMPAQEKMAPLLNETLFNALSCPIINNVDAALVTDGDAARQALIRQISSPVRWTESVFRMFDLGVETFVEIGPGKVLIGLIKAIAKETGKEVRLFNVEDEASLLATLDSISG